MSRKMADAREQIKIINLIGHKVFIEYLKIFKVEHKNLAILYFLKYLAMLLRKGYGVLGGVYG